MIKKIQIGVSGLSGRIGQQLIAVLEEDKQACIACGLVSEKSTFQHKNIPLSSVCAKADIWIDFSTPLAFDKVLRHCIETGTPLVSGTTGLSDEQFLNIQKAAEYIPILWASNFAISINLIMQMLSKYAKLNEISAKIVETHHVHKADKPSGTAISLAKSIEPQAKIQAVDAMTFKLGSVEIQSIREKEVAGIHQVYLENEAESIWITHSAKTPQIFAQGAVNVAKWLLLQEKAYYTMDDYIEYV